MTELSDLKIQAVREALYCEKVLAKSGESVVHRTLGDAADIITWKHFPADDVYDPETGAQWYYHCHPSEDGSTEHGHFHCFLRPDGREGPIHHLVAIGVNARGQLLRLFTVNHWVVGDDWLGAEQTIDLLPRFQLQLAKPCYLVNRWLSAVVTAFGEDIAGLIRSRDAAITGHEPENGIDAKEDRSLEVASEMPADLTAIADDIAPG